MITKNVKLAELNTNIATASLNIQTLKVIQWNINVYVATRIVKKV